MVQVRYLLLTVLLSGFAFRATGESHLPEYPKDLCQRQQTRKYTTVPADTATAAHARFPSFRPFSRDSLFAVMRNIKSGSLTLVCKVDTFEERLYINDLKGYDLDLGCTVFTNDVSFGGLKTNANISLAGATFLKMLSINNCHFRGNLDFRLASLPGFILSNDTFSFPVDFHRTRLIDVEDVVAPVMINNCYFKHQLSFQNQLFDVNNVLAFSNNKLDSTADFRSVRFKANALINNNHFREMVNFRGLQTKEEAIVAFSENEYHRICNFSHSKFGGSGVTLANEKFRDVLNFSNAVFNAKVSVKDCYFPQQVMLQEAKLNEVLNLTYLKDSLFIRQGDTAVLRKVGKKHTGMQPHIIDFTSTDVTNLVLFYEAFQIDTVQKEDNRKVAMYLNLLKSIEKQGFTESYQLLDLEYRDFLHHKDGDAWQIFLYHLKKSWWNFGYNKERILVWSMIFFLVLSIPIMFRPRFWIKNIYTIKVIDGAYTRMEENNRSTPLKRALLGLYYNSLIFFGFRMEFANFHKSANIWGALYINFVYLVGLVCLAFVANWIIS